MKATHRRKGALPPAFTLIEILVVIAIIMVLAAMSLSGYDYVKRKEAVSRTTVFVKNLGNALEQYRSDNGAFPEGDGIADSTKDVYASLYGDFDGDGVSDDDAQVYLSILSPDIQGKSKKVRKSGDGYVLVDAWRSKDDDNLYQELFYRHNPTEDPSSPDPAKMNPPTDFDLWSFGPDGEGGPPDAPGSTKENRIDDINNWK
jgi:type II secretory pathway pseudopilin PulG